MFKVSSRVEIPAHAGMGRPTIYPFAKMAVGDSFEVPAGEAKKARVAANNWKRPHPGWSYTTRTQDDGSVRIWRIA